MIDGNAVWNRREGTAITTVPYNPPRKSLPRSPQASAVPRDSERITRAFTFWYARAVEGEARHPAWMLSQTREGACFLCAREETPVRGDELKFFNTASPAETPSCPDPRPALPRKGWVLRLAPPVGETCRVSVSFTSRDAEYVSPFEDS